MQVIEAQPDNIGMIRALAPNTFPEQSSALVTQPEESGAWETFNAALERDNLSFEVLRYLGVKGLVQPDGDQPDTPTPASTEPDPNWNQYRYIRENWTPERQKAMEFEIRAGHFDGINTPDQVEQRASAIEYDKRRNDIIGRGPSWAAMVGSLAGNATDLTSYVPFVNFTKIAKVGRAASMAANFGLSSSMQEVGLHQLQPLRTMQESFLNIGSATVLGAGMGSFIALLHPKSPYLPGHPDNPLHPNNLDKQPLAFRTPDGELEIIGPGSVGAARQGAPKAEKGILSDIPGVSWLGEKITGVTPAGRALSWASPKAREMMLRLMDLGGRLTDWNRHGIPNFGRSGEDVRNDLIETWKYTLLQGEKAWRDTNIALGQSSAAMTVGMKGVVPKEDFADIVRRRGLQTWSEADDAALAQKYGAERAQIVRTNADKYVEAIHQTNEVFADRLMKLGKLQDPKRIGALKHELDQLKGQIPLSRSAGLEDEVSSLKMKQERVKQELEAELGKPANLGRDYFHAQMWDRYSVMQKQEAFEDFLFDVFVEKPDGQWLLNQHGILPSDFAKLGKEPVSLPKKEGEPPMTVEDGAKLRQKILREWVGDEGLYLLSRAERQAASAERASKESKTDLLATARELGAVDRGVTKLRTREARAIGKQLELERVEADRWATLNSTMNRAFVEASTAAKSRTLVRDRFAVAATREELDAAAGAVKAAEDRLFREVSDGLKDPATAGRIEYSGSYAKAVENLSNADARLQDLISRSPDVPENARLAVAEERAKHYAREAQKAQTKALAATNRAGKFEVALENLRSSLEHESNMKAFLEDRLKVVREAHKLREKDLRAAIRELRKQQKRTPLSEAVDQTRFNLMNHDQLPYSIAEWTVQTTGRAKERMINLTPEQRIKGEEFGFLRTDLPNILENQYHQLAGYIGLHEGLGIQKGGTFESWDDVLRSVSDDYDQLIGKASGKQLAKMTAERDSVARDLNLLKDRLLGTENPGADRDGWFYWLSRKVRQTAFVRYVAGFLPASFGDMASVYLRTGSLANLLSQHGAQAAQMMSKMYKENLSEFQAMVVGSELGTQGVRMARAFDIDDTKMMMGLGAPGTTKHNITMNVDRGMNWLVDHGNIVSGMMLWNRFWKLTAGIQRAYAIRDAVAKYSTLKGHAKADLAQLGIGDGEAARIHNMIAKHSHTDEKGYWDPNFTAWTDTDAARDFRVAVQKEMRRAIFTPGIGDTPAFMSKEAGKLFGLFQTYAYTFMNRFLMPASQRIRSYQDMQAVVAFVHLAWLGMMSTIAKDIINGRDPMERFKAENWGNTTKEVIDRSGMLSYLSPYIDSALKWSAPVQRELFGEVQVGPTSRYAARDWGTAVLGAGFGLFQDLQQFGSALSEGDQKNITKKGLALLPYNAYFRLGTQLNSVLEDQP